MADVEAPATPSLPVALLLVDLPTDFTQRIRALPSSTILHVPASSRLRMISVVAQCWNGMAQGRDDYAQLEEGRSKLLLSTVPQGLSVATEVQKRLTLWEERSFETLLQRVEEQLLLKRKAGKRRKSSGPSDPSERGDRARRTAAVGAYRKATTGLVSSMLSFNEQEDTRWAQELLPTSNLGSVAHCDPQLAPPPPALPESTWDRPFSGLHYAALTAPGPTGTRPEHITDLLNVPRIPTRFMLRYLRCFAGFLLAPCLLLPGGSLGHGSAGNARKTASRVQSRWVSSFALLTPSAWSTCPRCTFAPRLCTCISGASTCRGRAKPCVTGEARLNL